MIIAFLPLVLLLLCGKRGPRIKAASRAARSDHQIEDKYGEDPNLGKLSLGFVGVLLGSVLGGAFGFGSRKVYEAP